MGDSRYAVLGWRNLSYSISGLPYRRWQVLVVIAPGVALDDPALRDLALDLKREARHHAGASLDAFDCTFIDKLSWDDGVLGSHEWGDWTGETVNISWRIIDRRKEIQSFINELGNNSRSSRRGVGKVDKSGPARTPKT